MAKAVYDQFILFGDSITELSYDPNIGFGFGAALQNGEDCIVGAICRTQWPIMTDECSQPTTAVSMSSTEGSGKSVQCP